MLMAADELTLASTGPLASPWVKFIRHAITGEERWLVINVHVQMRLGRTAGVTDTADNLTGADLIPDLQLHGARSHMRIKYEVMGRNLDDDVIASGIVEVYRDGILA